MAGQNRWICLLLAMLLILGGCASASGEYYQEKEHVAQLGDSGETPANAISNYYMLQTALQNMIRSGRESDNIRISDYRGDLDEDLEAVREYFMTVYPLGVYAVQGTCWPRSNRVGGEAEGKDAAQAGDGPDKVRTADSGHGRTGHAVMLHGDGAAGSDDDDF